jgi:hypothetical protein
LTFAGGSEVGDGGLEADGERNIGEEARNVGDIGNGSGGGDRGGAAGANPFLSVLDDADESTQPMDDYQFEQAFPHCARNMFSLWLQNNADVHPLGKLISMGSGLTPEELQQPRIDQYIASKWITKSDKKVISWLYLICFADQTDIVPLLSPRLPTICSRRRSTDDGP